MEAIQKKIQERAPNTTLVIFRRVKAFIRREQPFIRRGSFRFLDLPAELRVHIYSYLLPHNIIITHERKHDIHKTSQEKPWWGINATNKKTGEVEHMRIGSQPSFARRPDWPRSQTQLMLVNKQISSEVQAVLYGSNTYKFTITSSAHYPISLASPLIFGPFGDLNGSRLPLLCNLRSIRIELVLDDDDHWAVKRQRARLEYFVDILKQHSDDENRKSLLEELVIDVQIELTEPTPNVEKFMFGLESLATLRGIKKVTITGVPDWFAKCLALCIQGKGGDVLETDWPLVMKKRKLKTTRFRWTEVTKVSCVSTRKWYQPMLNWTEFAERNGVVVPADVDKLWVALD
jgi:hypothetical protein